MKTLHTIYTSFAKRLAIILTLLLTLGVTQVWGALSSPSACIFTSSNSTSLSDDNTDVTWIASTKPSGFESSGDMRGLQWSGSVVNGGLTLSCSSYSSYTITKIEVVWSRNNGAGASVSTTVGGKSFGSSDTNNAKTTNRKATFTGSEKGNIVIEATSTATNNSFYIKSITVTYEDVASCTYIVQFDSNGGTSTMSDQTFTCDVPQKLTANSFSRTGYTFAGWATSENGSVAYTDQQLVNLSSTNNDNIPLYAQWTPTQYTITYNGLEGATHSNPTKYTIESETITFTDPSERVGYKFTGWNPASITKGSTGNKTVTAQWKAKDLTNYRTTCTEPCEQLGDATGLSVQTDYEEGGQTYVKFSWTPADNTKSHAIKQVICIGKVGEEKKCTDLEGNQVWSGDLRSKLTPGEYEWTIQAIGDGATYCDGEVISGPNFTIEEPLTDNCRWVEIPIEDITPEDEIVVTMGDDKTVYALGTETIDPSPKSQAITITSGMIDINQDFDYSQYTWSISAVTGGYQLQPYGTTQYLYGVASYITISSNPTTFSIFTSPENGNKCFMYTVEYTPYYLGHGTDDGQTAWKRFPSSTNLLKSNTLKFYKKACLPANKFWIDYELANVTCTNTPPPFAN